MVRSERKKRCGGRCTNPSPDPNIFTSILSHGSSEPVCLALVPVQVLCGHLKVEITAISNSSRLYNTYEKSWAWLESPRGLPCMGDSKISLSIEYLLLFKARKHGAGGECLLGTSTGPYIPKDVAAVGNFRKLLLLCWFWVDLKCPGPLLFLAPLSFPFVFPPALDKFYWGKP